MAITKDQVFETASQLVSEGKEPTLANVRAVLGSGSYSTITGYMQEWRATWSKADIPIREVAPAAVNERLDALGAEVWAIALDIANGRLKSEREALEQARQEMEQQQHETAELADQMAAEIEQLRTELDEVKLSRDIAIQSEQAVKQQWALEQDDNIKLKAQLEGADKRIEDMLAEVVRYRTAADADRAERERLVERDIEQRTTLAESRTENNRLFTETQRLANDRDEVRAHLKKLDEHCRKLDIAIAQLTAERDGLNKLADSQQKIIEAFAVKLKPEKPEHPKRGQQPTKGGE